jgi:hypothetical protein
MHHLPDRLASFLHVTTELGHQLKLTEDHLIFASSCNSSDDFTETAIAARELEIGDCLSMLGSTIAGRMGTSKVAIADIRQVSESQKFAYYCGSRFRLPFARLGTTGRKVSTLSA